MCPMGGATFPGSRSVRMDQLAKVLLITLLPVGGSIAGAVLAELWRTPKWLVGAALHAATGVAIGLVSIEFMPRSLDTTPVWLIALLFSAGGAISVLLGWTVLWLRDNEARAGAGKWQVYATTGADLFSDGLMTGATFAVSSSLGLLLATSQVVANLPGGFATAANFRQRGLERRWRLAAALGYAVPPLVGATAGFLLLRGAGETAQNAMLALIAGVLLVTTVEELVPQADRPGTRRWASTTAFVLGFVFIALLAAYVG